MGQYIGLITKSGVAGISSANTNATIEDNNKLSIANADTKNRVRAAGNLAEAAQGNLARFTQSVNNNRALKAGGEAEEALTVNAIRHNDAAMRGDFSDDIRSAEQLGHAAASAAASGVSGSVVDMVNTSTALRDSIVKQGVADDAASESYDVSRRAGNIMSQVVGGLDSSVILDSLDYNQNVAFTNPTRKRTLIDKVFMPMGAITGQSVANDFGALSGQDQTQLGKVAASGATSVGGAIRDRYARYQAGKSIDAEGRAFSGYMADGYNPNASPSSNTGYNFDYDYSDANAGISIGGADGAGGDSYDYGDF